MIGYRCAWCWVACQTATGAFNRAKKRGAPLYCGRECSGLARRQHKSLAEKRTEKAAYDAEYRRRNLDVIKAKKAAYFVRTYDSAAAAEKRKARMPHHVAYCRRPEYVAWKADYDRTYRADKCYGEFSECFLLSQDIRAECLSQLSDYEIRQQAGTASKQSKRKRDYDRLDSNKPEIGALGNP